ncbi:protein ULTRAPETALA 1 isoform X1 [Dendrobium catenatum]|uniref:Protein ULTRAPETALA 1 n=1 Tax=Dendrobium catenatum TaxID=906689 RepID=A0A2I0WML2_9ASPA|nr:protein ULTRAPETALA 1 isoform X1 [Dendrobium catenatum]PKU76891.1 Protein ULTRAPETALA 1 [Dendrobium catenatum]
MARDSARSIVLFTDEELNGITGVKKGEDFVEVTCGCTSPRYGDAVGRLRVFASGKLEVACECCPGCREDKLTPSAFEKHAGRENPRRWKYYVWVIVKGKKIPLLKTALLKYHEKVYGGSSYRGNKGKPCHRDEFVRCSICNKERRFRRQTKVDCRTYHDAVLDANWKCSDLPSDEYSCDDEEERASRRSIRGCSRTALCKGCTLCVCFGCEICRFPDCACQTCIDFVNNSPK